jgi:hypothetical protein
MEKPVRRSLLPGVRDAGTPPAVVIDSRAIIVRARRRAAVRDVLDLVLLLCVDGLFLGWPRAHVPMLGRFDSLLALGMLNAAMIAFLWLTRSYPRWRARRVASTWCPAERGRIRL